jgi:hypothetical protein
MLFVDFARRHGADPEVAAEALSGPEGWSRFVEYLGSLRAADNIKRGGV